MVMTPEISYTAEGWAYLADEVPFGDAVANRHELDTDTWDMKRIRPWLSGRHVAIDVGAHFGSFTIPMLREIRHGGTVIAFEPHPDSFECLSHNVHKFLRETGSTKKAITSDMAITIWNDLYVITEPNEYQGAFVHVSQSVNPSATILPIKGMRLDDILKNKWLKLNEPVEFIKIDVEGSELDVLQTGANLIKTYKPAIFMEVNEHTLARRCLNPDDILRYMDSIGYRWEVVRTGNQGHKFECYDILATHKKFGARR